MRIRAPILLAAALLAACGEEEQATPDRTRVPRQEGHDEAQVEAMHQAWFKAVTVSVVLWSRPYAERRW
jgi:hypothetical protein